MSTLEQKCIWYFVYRMWENVTTLCSIYVIQYTNLMRHLILASGSIRRKDIMEFLGVPFSIVRSDFPEEDVHWDLS